LFQFFPVNQGRLFPCPARGEQQPQTDIENRVKFFDSQFGRTLVAVHPSALLRLPPGVDANAEFEKFVADLRLISES
jgi:hypothetical protein